MNTLYKDLNKRGNTLTNVSAILNYISNLLNTRVGELPFNRAFGTYLEDYLFEPYSFIQAKKIELEIKRAISKWIPMVYLKDVTVDFDVNTNTYKITIVVIPDKIGKVVEYTFEKGLK